MSTASKFAFKRVGAETAAPAAASAPQAQTVAPAAAVNTPAAVPAVAAPAPAQAVTQVAPVAAAQAAEVVAAVPAAAVSVQPAARPEPAVASTAVAVQPAPGAVTEYRAPASYADDSDSLGMGDLKLPRINIVQKVGDLSNIFTPGDIVINGESVVLESPGAKGDNKDSHPLVIVVTGFRSDRYAEKVAGGGQGRLVNNVEEVVKAGGTLDYNENKATGKPLFQQLAEGLILVQKPEGLDDPQFSYIADGKYYAPFLWAMKGTAFTNGAKVFRTARKIGWLKDVVNPVTKEVMEKRGYTFGVWSLTTVLKGYGENFAWIPQLSRVGETSAELRALANSLIGS